ncbi:MAG: RnfABCDGE type electron transport complex subunit D [Oscillospiraceae bacterium]|nr:RnfABCDGE type electron transport complex subunit D [Oscillospiraceae bacterium]MBR5261349.1 RnfABCDGE type electron transport complex subunit D [Oscillospiraceae bacterium]
MSKLNVTVSPHLRHKDTTQSIMRDVLIALAPAAIAAIVLFGIRALLLEVVCVGTAIFWEWAFQKICKRKTTICDLSAAVTGLILALNLPSTLPLWQAAFGTLVAIVVVKQLFGGIGYNFANPAITARVVMLIAFAGTMTTWTTPAFADAVSGATPLAQLGAGENVSLMSLFLGTVGGSMGETSALALLIGFVYLLVRRVITWHTPVAFIATVFVLSLLKGGFEFGLAQILAGGVFLGAIFMATDYVTTPQTPAGRLVFGIGCGLITCLIRFFGAYPEGVSFSILLMNILTPYISKWTASKPFGGVKA